MKNLYFEVETNEVDLNLKRRIEPVDVSLKAEKLLTKISYKIHSDLMIYVTAYFQEADDKQFNCYSFKNLVVGSCSNADINISSSNPKYNVLGDNLVLVTGDVSSIAFGFKKFLDKKSEYNIIVF